MFSNVVKDKISDKDRNKGKDVVEVISKAEVVNFTGETRLSPTELKSQGIM